MGKIKILLDFAVLVYNCVCMCVSTSVCWFALLLFNLFCLCFGYLLIFFKFHIEDTSNTVISETVAGPIMKLFTHNITKFIMYHFLSFFHLCTKLNKVVDTLCSRRPTL